MPDALFHYALLAHMRSSCIRRRLKKSIFPTLPSSSRTGSAAAALQGAGPYSCNKTVSEYGTV